MSEPSPEELVRRYARRVARSGIRLHTAKNLFRTMQLASYLAAAGGSTTKAARLADVDRGDFTRMMRRHGLNTVDQDDTR